MTEEVDALLDATCTFPFSTLRFPRTAPLTGRARAADYILQHLATTGLDVRPVWSLIHSANMSKFGEGGYLREDGKWMKPPNFVAPDVYSHLTFFSPTAVFRPFAAFSPTYMRMHNTGGHQNRNRATARGGAERGEGRKHTGLLWRLPGIH